MDDVYAGLTELLRPAERGQDYAWTEDTGGDELLRAGDRLLVLVTADGQDYYILQKAVFS